MSQALSRKQREIQQRDHLILDAATDILRQEGFNALSMERIAQAIEYARATIYQHYPNKEEIVAALCIRSMRSMVDLFDRALEFKGRSRERIVAVMLAYELYWRLYPNDMQDFQVIKNEAIRSKLSEASLETISSLEQHTLGCIASVVREALAEGDITLTDITPEELIFGLWAMAFGAISLHSSDIPLAELGVSNPMATARAHARRLLDGYNWQPTSDSWNYDKTVNQILNSVFAKESANISFPKEKTA
ncbi:probable regulator AmrR [gamma proteobacterium HTCC5015]|nr:probable regulator AmrR [gamma proteobacterium HTCC5015]